MFPRHPSSWGVFIPSEEGCFHLSVTDALGAIEVKNGPALRTCAFSIGSLIQFPFTVKIIFSPRGELLEFLSVLMVDHWPSWFTSVVRVIQAFWSLWFLSAWFPGQNVFSAQQTSIYLVLCYLIYHVVLLDPVLALSGAQLGCNLYFCKISSF